MFALLLILRCFMQRTSYQCPSLNFIGFLFNAHITRLQCIFWRGKHHCRMASFVRLPRKTLNRRPCKICTNNIYDALHLARFTLALEIRVTAMKQAAFWRFVQFLHCFPIQCRVFFALRKGAVVSETAHIAACYYVTHASLNMFAHCAQARMALASHQAWMALVLQQPYHLCMSQCTARIRSHFMTAIVLLWETR